MNTKESFLNAVSHLITLCSIRLSDDVASALQKLADGETDETAKTMYRCIADDLALADRLHRPICQDTGMLQFFLDVGTGFPYMGEIEPVLTEAVRRATKETPLRPNAVSPIGEKNTGDNTGYGAIHCAFPGGCAVVAAQCVEEIEDVEWEDFGMAEALWVLRVKEFGPLIVSIDTQGNNLFAENQARYESRLKQITD